MTARQNEVTHRLKQFLGGRCIDWTIVCGSGLSGALVDDGSPFGLTDQREISLADLGLPAPTVAGHGQALVWGKVGERSVCLQTGRLHPYEGHPIGTSIAALQATLDCGARRVLLTAATGALRTDLRPGQLVLLRDQINLFGPTPLVGPRFVDCSQIYDLGLRKLAENAARATNTTLVEGVYAHARGPQYESPAEVAALRMLGGDVVGMSTTYEAIAAVASGASVCGVALVTNTAADVGLDHDDVQRLSRAAHSNIATLARALIGLDGDRAAEPAGSST